MLHRTMVLVLAVLVVTAFAQTTFYLLPSPPAFTIFNEYQQSLSPQEAAALPAYFPLQLVKREVLLGDGISHAAQFRLLGHDWYLLTEGGRFTGETRRNAPIIVSGCVPIGDTIEVVRGGGVRIEPVSGPAIAPRQGSLLVRIFRRDGRQYVLTTGRPVRCGWIPLEPAGAWRTLHDRPRSTGPEGGTDTTLTGAVLRRVRERIAAVNASYRNCFGHFDTLTGSPKSIPQWSCKPDGRGLRCILSAPYAGTDQLEGSTRQLRQEIETMLIGSGFTMGGGSGEIVIRRSPKGR